MKQPTHAAKGGEPHAKRFDSNATLLSSLCEVVISHLEHHMDVLDISQRQDATDLRMDATLTGEDLSNIDKP